MVTNTRNPSSPETIFVSSSSFDQRGGMETGWWHKYSEVAHRARREGGVGEQKVAKEHEGSGFDSRASSVRATLRTSVPPAGRGWLKFSFEDTGGLQASEMNEGQPTYKLIYFDARGRAEHIRYIFAYAGIDFVDERIPKESWPELKKLMPYGMLPVLEIDGKPIAQSNAVARYLARKHNLTGRDEWEAMMCDVLVDTLGDLKQFISQYRTEEDPFKKNEKKAKLLKETIPFYLNKFEQTVGENGGYAVGSTTTWADFVFAVALENFENMFGVTALERYPGLRALKTRVHKIPSIVEWLTKRPHTEF